MVTAQECVTECVNFHFFLITEPKTLHKTEVCNDGGEVSEDSPCIRSLADIASSGHSFRISAVLESGYAAR